jgi:outer membrane protein OmpA-like peptidoglycan-associated protein
MRLGGLLLAAAFPIAACSHATQAAKAESPPAPAPAVEVAAPAPAPVPAAVESVPKACSSDDQCASKELCLSAQCVAIKPGLAECRTSAHFDFDGSELHPDDMPGLQRVARCLNALPGEHTLVEGNCDERGTVQYNIALGFRRAHAVAKYVEDLGVPSTELSEVSYGKELPICSQSTESCWAMNRRADVAHRSEPENVAAKIQADERRERPKEAAARPAQGATAPKPTAQARHPISREQPAAADSTATPSK